MGSLPFALQLYTVRDALQENPERTLRAVKEMGYDHVELAGTAGLPPEAFKKMLDETGLKPVSTHTSLEELGRNPSSTIEYCRTFGVCFAVVGAGEPDKEAWLAAAKKMDEGGARLQEAGVQLCYHNHSHEFRLFDGETAMDLLFDHTAPEHLAAELDLFWVAHAGVDVVSVLRKYAGRCPLLHVKDMAPAGVKPIFANLGSGTMDWPPIIEAAREAGAQWYIVEQDDCPGDPLESARAGAEFMAKQ